MLYHPALMLILGLNLGFVRNINQISEACNRRCNCVNASKMNICFLYEHTH